MTVGVVFVWVVWVHATPIVWIVSPTSSNYTTSSNNTTRGTTRTMLGQRRGFFVSQPRLLCFLPVPQCLLYTHNVLCTASDAQVTARTPHATTSKHGGHNAPQHTIQPGEEGRKEQTKHMAEVCARRVHYRTLRSFFLGFCESMAPLCSQ